MNERITFDFEAFEDFLDQYFDGEVDDDGNVFVNDKIVIKGFVKKIESGMETFMKKFGSKFELSDGFKEYYKKNYNSDEE